MYTKNQCFYNCKKKYYPNGLVKVVLCNSKIFNNGFEPVDTTVDTAVDTTVDTAVDSAVDSSVDNKLHSIRRARQKIFDLAMLNRFDYFITLTFDKEKIDRYNNDVVYKYIQKYLNNCVNRKNLKYVIVPEKHKDGALHFHGLFSGDFTFIDSGKFDKNGNKIFNVKDWKKGFSTAVKIRDDSSDSDYSKVCGYICKYISKQHSEMIKGRYYLSGGDLIRDVPTFYSNVDFSDYELPQYETGYGTAFKYFDYYDTNFNELLLEIENS